MSNGSGRWIGAVTLWLVCAAGPFLWLKPMSNDEIYTMHVARLGSPVSIWNALAAGADNHPPLDYWVRHASMAIFGQGPFGLRLPSLLAVWLASVFTFFLISRQSAAPYGFAAAALMLLADGYESGLRTRGHALLLCFYTMTVVGWDLVTAGRRRAAGRVLLVTGLVGAVYSHFYGLLHFVSIVGAALTVSWQRRRLQQEPLMLVALAGLLCVPLAPIARAASQFRDNFWTPITVTAALDFYPSLLWGVTPCLVVMGTLFAVWSSRGSSEVPSGRFSPATLAALAWFAALPVYMFILARFVTGAFLPRYGIAAAAAIGSLAIVLVSRIALGTRLKAMGLVLVPLICLTVLPLRQVTGIITHQKRLAFTDRLWLLQRQGDVPVVLGDAGLFVELVHADVHGNLTNCYYIFDTHPGRRSVVDRALIGLKMTTDVRALEYDGFRARYRGFRFVGSWDDRVLARARQEGSDVRFIGSEQDGLEYWNVSFPGGDSSTASSTALDRGRLN